MISALIFRVLERKDKLVTYLNHNSDDLPLEKQHQLYGAINELETILDILNEHREKEIEKAKNPDEIFLFKPLQEKGFFRDMVDSIKDIF